MYFFLSNQINQYINGIVKLRKGRKNVRMKQHCATEGTKKKNKFHTASVYGMDEGYEGLQGEVRRVGVVNG